MPGVLWDIFEPTFKSFGYNAPDPTYGRWTMPVWEPEARLDADSSLATVQRRLFIPAGAPPESVDIEHAEDVKLTADELSKDRRRGGRWVYYKSWEKKPQGEEQEKKMFGRGVDLCYVHGLNEYG